MDPGTGQMPEPTPDPMPEPDEMSELSKSYDMTAAGVDEMLPAGSTHLIEDISAAQMRAGGTPLEHPRARYTHGGNRIVSSGNTWIEGPRVGSWDRRSLEFTCMGTVCSLNPPFQIDVLALTKGPKVVSKVLARNGISLLQFSFRTEWEIPDRYGHSVQDGLTLMSDVASGKRTTKPAKALKKQPTPSGSMHSMPTLQAGSLQAQTRWVTRPTGASWPAAWWRRIRKLT